MDENTDNFEELVKRGVESEKLDYKGPLDFRAIGRAGQAKIARHMAALANSGGGHIVIGVSEDAAGHPSVYAGLNAAEAHSFDPSSVGPVINHLIEPPIDFVIERPLVDGKRYAIIKVRPFTSMPHVCSQGVSPELQQGVFYIRTHEAASRPATRAVELHGLIKRALLNQRSQLAELLRDVLSEEKIPVNSGDSSSYFDEDAAYSRGYFIRRKRKADGMNSRVIELQLRPMWEYDQQKFTLEEIHEAITSAAEKEFSGGNLLTARDIRSAYFTNSSIRSMPDNEFRMWQLSRSGLFELLVQLEKELNNFESLRIGLEGALQKIAHIYRYLADDEDKVEIILSVYDGEKQLADPLTLPSGSWSKECNILSINSEEIKSLILNLADHIL